MKLLEARADRERFAVGFRDLSASRERYYGAELTQVWSNNTALGDEVAAWLVNSMTNPQRVRFDDRLAELAADFRSLGDPDAPAPAPEDLCVVLTC